MTARRLLLCILTAAGLSSTIGCCGSICGVGNCGAGNCGTGCGGSCWYPGKAVVDSFGGCQGCGGAYWNEWYNDPPGPGPCARCGKRAGCGSCGGGCSSCGGGGWTGGASMGGSSCGCSGGGGSTMSGETYEDGDYQQGQVPTPATAARPRPTHASAQPYRYNNVARQPTQQRRIRPVSHEEQPEEESDRTAQASGTSSGIPCMTCRR